MKLYYIGVSSDPAPLHISHLTPHPSFPHCPLTSSHPSHRALGLLSYIQPTKPWGRDNHERDIKTVLTMDDRADHPEHGEARRAALSRL